LCLHHCGQSSVEEVDGDVDELSGGHIDSGDLELGVREGHPGLDDSH